MQNRKKQLLTLLASGSRQVCEFCESETAFGETIDGLLLSLRPGRLEMMISCVGLIFSPAREDDENERVFRWEEDDNLRVWFEEEEGTFKDPIAAIVAIVVREEELHSSLFFCRYYWVTRSFLFWHKSNCWLFTYLPLRLADFYGSGWRGVLVYSKQERFIRLIRVFICFGGENI